MKEKARDLGLLLVGMAIVVFFFIGALIIFNVLGLVFFFVSLFNPSLHKDLGRDVIDRRKN